MYTLISRGLMVGAVLISQSWATPPGSEERMPGSPYSTRRAPCDDRLNEKWMVNTRPVLRPEERSYFGMVWDAGVRMLFNSLSYVDSERDSFVDLSPADFIPAHPDIDWQDYLGRVMQGRAQGQLWVYQIRYLMMVSIQGDGREILLNSVNTLSEFMENLTKDNTGRIPPVGIKHRFMLKMTPFKHPRHGSKTFLEYYFERSDLGLRLVVGLMRDKEGVFPPIDIEGAYVDMPPALPPPVGSRADKPIDLGTPEVVRREWDGWGAGTPPLQQTRDVYAPDPSVASEAAPHNDSARRPLPSMVQSLGPDAFRALAALRQGGD